MMLPNQINNQRFSAVGKGGYRASEVDAFIQRVFQNYSKLYSDNNILRERLSAITPLIDEYNENKRAIADALIWAKTTSDKTVDQARGEAESLIENAKAEAEKIIADKTSEAKAVYAQELDSSKAELEKIKGELELTRRQADDFSEKYIAEINTKAASLIEEANANASRIVSDAYKDAQAARDKADEIIKEANEELEAIKNEAAKLKAEIEKAVKLAVESVSVISVSEIKMQEAPVAEAIEASQIDLDEIEEFTFDFDEEIEKVQDFIEEKQDSESGFTLETAFDAFSVEVKSEESVESEDLISGGSNTSMPDVNAYISKIFDSAGSEGSDFSAFVEGLDDAFASSLEESDISFDDLKTVMENGKVYSDEED